MPNRWVEFAARGMPPKLVLLVWTLSVGGCVTANNGPTAPLAVAGGANTAPVALARPIVSYKLAAPYSVPRTFDGVASYYSAGTYVATGARFNPDGLTAAHRSLPFGTRLRVNDPKTRRSVIVTINDRGPFVHGRVLDLSVGAARALGMKRRGLSRVHAEVM
jgi:rare lipoprotein A